MLNSFSLGGSQSRRMKALVGGISAQGKPRKYSKLHNIFYCTGYCSTPYTMVPDGASYLLPMIYLDSNQATSIMLLIADEVGVD